MSRNRKRLEMAFPCVYRHPDGSILNQWTGMSLREWFAGQALAGWMAREDVPPFAVMAERCYEIADAMLDARGGQ